VSLCKQLIQCNIMSATIMSIRQHNPTSQRDYPWRPTASRTYPGTSQPHPSACQIFPGYVQQEPSHVLPVVSTCQPSVLEAGLTSILSLHLRLGLFYIPEARKVQQLVVHHLLRKLVMHLP